MKPKIIMDSLGASLSIIAKHYIDSPVFLFTDDFIDELLIDIFEVDKYSATDTLWMACPICRTPIPVSSYFLQSLQERLTLKGTIVPDCGNGCKFRIRVASPIEIILDHYITLPHKPRYSEHEETPSIDELN